jgi:hypothetical protein
MSHIKCCRFSNVSANIAVAIFRANVYWAFRKSYIDQTGGEWDEKDLICETENKAGR